MTALRPERDSAAPYGEDAVYGGAAAFEAPDAFEGAGAFDAARDFDAPRDGDSSRDFGAARDFGAPGEAQAGGAMRAAVDGLADPLGDPLPGQRQPVTPEQGWQDPQGLPRDWSVHQAASSYAEPVRRAHAKPAHGYAEPQPSPSPPPYVEPQRPYEEQLPSYGETSPQTSYDAVYAQPGYSPSPAPSSPPPSHSQSFSPPYEPPLVDDETVGLRIPGAQSIPGSLSSSSARGTAAASAASATGAPGGGRAARRKAARRHGRHGVAGNGGGGSSGAQEGREESGAPLSRVAARQAARARKPGAAVMASRAIGEVFITTGVLMLLFVTYQLWWTNVRAHAQAGNEASSLQDDWANGKRNPGTFEPGQGFALLHIPKLDVVVPIAEGIDKKRVLDRGMVGHYAEDGVKTAMPDAKAGNFGLAGHRNTHGEPFRYVNRLKPGDAIVVETQDKYYVYKMASILPVTSPSNTSVLDAIPKAGGFTKAGRYITLTTCTPEFTSKYRMIVWGTMAEERPRSEGKPDALVG